MKPQVAFFERMGWRGVRALEQVVQHATDAGLMVILDAKRGDIGSTAKAYAEATLNTADAVTVSPYLGPESLTPFQEHPGKGLFVLVRTSNPGASLWQTDTGTAEAVAEWVQAQAVATMGADALGDVGAVVGATVPEEAAHWRDAMPNAWLLVPGFGAQGGTATTADPLFRSDGLGALVVSARGVLYGDHVASETNWQDAVRVRAQRLAATFASKL
ncbi:MAG: orotidine-5'-phosphate decarboxylase [bacterium]